MRDCQCKSPAVVSIALVAFAWRTTFAEHAMNLSLTPTHWGDQEHIKISGIECWNSIGTISDH